MVVNPLVVVLLQLGAPAVQYRCMTPGSLCWLYALFTSHALTGLKPATVALEYTVTEFGDPPPPSAPRSPLLEKPYVVLTSVGATAIATSGQEYPSAAYI